MTFLIDADAYFRAFMDVASRAEHTILLVGWDINGAAVLQPGGEEGPTRLAPFLRETLSRRPRVDVYLLAWDFSMVYAFERDWVPLFSGGWIRHPRLHYKLDGKHPFVACHHQKIAVIDDAVAFVGGLDFARQRWDTSEHLAHDPRRRDEDEHPYPPFHDVQVAVDGPVAGALGELARRRWLRATGRRLSPPPLRSDLWPAGIDPDLENVEVAIARTEPEYEEYEEVREVENLYLDAIDAAERSIYIENQYFTSASVTGALADKLAEEKGPEVMLVLPHACSGWLEQTSMGILRNWALDKLRKADRFGRLSVYYLVASGNDAQTVNVHAKVLVVDERLVRVGSSNLNNRSMGVDTECDLAIESNEDPVCRESIKRFRDRLLAEHLEVTPEELAKWVRSEGSLSSAVEKLRASSNRMRPLDPEIPEWVEALAPDQHMVDPERPVAPEELVRSFVDDNMEETAKNPWLRAVVVLGVLSGLAAGWRWTTPQWLSVENLTRWTAALQQHDLAPLFVVGAFVAASLVLVPVTVLILVTALTFSPLTATVYALSGAMTSSLVSFGVGKLLGRDTVRRLAGSRVNKISRHLVKRGLLASFAVHVVPVAPFTIVNLVAGASGIRLKDFAIGTFLGVVPGVVAITLFESRLEDVLRNPGWGSGLALGGVLLLIVAAFTWMHRRVENGMEHGKGV